MVRPATWREFLERLSFDLTDRGLWVRGVEQRVEADESDDGRIIVYDVIGVAISLGDDFIAFLEERHHDGDIPLVGPWADRFEREWRGVLESRRTGARLPASVVRAHTRGVTRDDGPPVAS